MKSKKVEKSDYKISIREYAVVILFYSVVISIAYSNSLNGTWAMDDILLNKTVGMGDIKHFMGFRSVAYLSFLVNQKIAPFSPVSFRVFNILLHIFNSSLVYILAYKTMSIFLTEQEHNLKRYRKEAGQSTFQNRAFLVAFLSGTIFGLHPININAVAYIVQRMALLSTFFTILALLCYIYASESVQLFGKVIFFSLCAISIFAGILSKENAVMAFPLILLYDYVFLSRFYRKAFIKRIKIFLAIGIFSIAMASYFLKLHHAFIDLLNFFLNPNRPLVERGWMSVDVYWTPLQHLLTEFRVVSRYIFLIFVPLPQLLVFDWWGFPVSKSLIEPITTISSMIFILSILMLSLMKIRRLPLIAFGILWYLIAISLESFFALGADLYFEHRNYLPVTGLIIGITGQIGLFFKRNISKKNLWIIVMIVSIVFGSLTFIRNLVWKDSVTLWGDTIKKVPHNIRAMKAMGNSYMRLTDLKNAEVYFERAIGEGMRMKAAQNLDESVFALGMIYLLKGELQRTMGLIERYETIIESYRPLILKGYYALLSDDFDRALAELGKVEGEADGVYRTIVLTLKGDALRSKGLLDQAMVEYNRALEEDITWVPAYHGMGVVYMLKRDINHAEEYFRKALEIEPDNVLVLSDMVDLMLIKRDSPDKIMSYAKKAIKSSPPFYQPYLAMANVFLVSGDPENAEIYYREAVQKGARDYMIILNKARMYFLKGDSEKAGKYILELRRLRGLPSRISEMIGGKG